METSFICQRGTAKNDLEYEHEFAKLCQNQISPSRRQEFACQVVYFTFTLDRVIEMCGNLSVGLLWIKT